MDFFFFFISASSSLWFESSADDFIDEYVEDNRSGCQEGGREFATQMPDEEINQK